MKKWVNEDKLWVRYKVNVQSSGQLVPLKAGLNAINSRLEIEVATLDTSLKPVKTYPLRIQSQFDSSKFAAGGKSGLDPESKTAVVPEIRRGPRPPASRSGRSMRRWRRSL